MKSTGNFTLHEAKFTALESELGGEITISPGRGSDYMEVAWEAEPGVIFYHRIEVNPAIQDAELDIAAVKHTFEYNRDREE